MAQNLPAYEPSELKDLMGKAEQLMNKSKDNNYYEVEFLYRNKDKSYFDDCKKNENLMQPRTKDACGDPRNLINGKLQGVFFCANKYNGEFPIISPYGPVRVLVPVEQILGNKNLYFADFYCPCPNKPKVNKPKVNKPHYVQLVVTEPNSPPDVEWRDRLPKLSLTDNPFLWSEGGKYYMRNTQEHLSPKEHNVWIEIFYTHSIKFDEKNLRYDIDVTGTGAGKKCMKCPICNLTTKEVDLTDKMVKMKFKDDADELC